MHAVTAPSCTAKSTDFQILTCSEIRSKILIQCVTWHQALSPLLFILYIADLAFALDDILTAIFFADDLVLIADNLPDLQRGLNRVNIFCDSHGLGVNDKTKAMKIRSGVVSRVDPLTSILAVLARSCQILTTSWQPWIPWQDSY